MNKPDFHNIKDIEGAAPAKLHGKFINKPNHFCVKDIPYARSNPRMFCTNRVIDPLAPQYKLPSFEAPPPYVPKFIRDHMDCSDVEGAKPAKRHHSKVRDTFGVADIDGAQPKAMPKRRNPSKRNEKLDPPAKSRSPVTNPLNPAYRINGVDIEDGAATRPRKMPSAKNYPYYPLLTTDIPGAHSSTSFVKAKTMVSKETERLRNPTNTRDIDGASSDSLQRGLRTKRATDPLQPDYVYLDGDKAYKPRKLFVSSTQEFVPRQVAIQKPNAESKSVQVRLDSSRPATAVKTGAKNAGSTSLNRPSTSAENTHPAGSPKGMRNEILIHKVDCKDKAEKRSAAPRPLKQKSRGAKSIQRTQRVSNNAKHNREDIQSVKNLPDSLGDNHSSLCFPRRHIM